MKNYKKTKKLSYHSMDMPPGEIRADLLREGITQAEIARRCNVSASMVSKVIDGLSVGHRVRTEIANAIKCDLLRLWPSTYLLHGGPRKVGRPKIMKDQENYQR